ncbi:MAG: hypothetical protein ACKO6Q_06710 [Bacteroidota bacterium]
MKLKCILIGCLSLFAVHIHAQSNVQSPSGKVVLFLPLQLDSIFTEQQEYRYGRYEFPRFVSGALEFYQGFEEALDSLKKRKGNIDVVVVDTKSESHPVSTLVDKDSIKNADIWLLHGNTAESKQLADYARAYNIPLVNINLPNDGGIQSNPYYFMWNSTLSTQCNGIYKHLQQYYALNRIILVRKKGNMEDKILNYWEQNGQRTPGVPLTYRIIEGVDTVSLKQLKSTLDSTQQTILVGASLDDRFARTLATAASELRTAGYKIELMGMSTWENVREFTTNRFKNLEVTIPTPFYYPKADALSKWLQIRFQNKNFGKVSDLYMRGYEIAWLLHPFLRENNSSLAETLPGKRKLLFAEVDWQAVTNPQSLQTDYFENKKLYFVKRMDGTIRSVR